MRRGLARVVDGILVALIVTVLGTVALGRLVPVLGATTLVVNSASMTPAISIGTAIVAVPVAPADLRVGDVVTVRPDGAATYTHRISRIIERNGERWVETTGDANEGADPAIVPASRVIGRVDWTIPWAGYLIWLLTVPTGVLFVLGLGGLLFVGASLLEPAHDRRAHLPAPAPGIDAGRLVA